MQNTERVYWDTTKDPDSYPKKIKKIYFRTRLNSRKSFTRWIGKISQNFFKDIDWWISLPATRNPYISNLYHYICLLKTLEILLNKHKQVSINVNSKSLYKIIKIWSENNNVSVAINYIGKGINLKNYLIIFKSIFFNFILFFYIKTAIKKNSIEKSKRKIVLIDTFATSSSIYEERLYNGLDKFFKKKKLKHVFFVPTFIIQFNILSVIKVINALKKRNYLFKEHYLKLKDFFFASFYFLRTKKFPKKYIRFEKWDLSKVICEEIFSGEDYSSKIISLLNYRFAKNLSKSKINLSKTVNWFENQTVDKGWNYGFRKFFPNSKTYGYQGFLYYPQYMNSIPAKYEEFAKIIPSEIISIGKAYVKPRKEFFSKLKISVGPALNFRNIYKKYIKKDKIKVLLILSGIKSLDIILLRWIDNIDYINKNIKIVVKPHPILPINKILPKNNLSNNFIISQEKLSNLLRETFIVICSGPTSATIESLVYSCFLIVPVIDALDAISLKKLNIPSKKYCLVYDKDELFIKIRKLINNKSIQKEGKKSISKLRSALFEKVNNKNLEFFY